MHSLQIKIFALVFGLILAIQAISLFTLHARIHNEAVRSLGERLKVGRQVFLHQFHSRGRSLSIYSEMIAKDFGLLQAFHEGHHSLLMALDDRRRRVGADVAVVVNTRDRIMADTARPQAFGEKFNALKNGSAQPVNQSLFLDMDGRTYQLVAAPLKTPNLVGWVFLGFVVDDSLAHQFETLTSLKVSFLEKHADNHWELVASTLPDSARAALAQRLPESATLPADGAETLHNETYLGLDVNLAQPPSLPMVALLQRSESAAMAHYSPWWRQIVEVLAGALLLALIGALALARSVARPLKILVNHAHTIADGDYVQPLKVSSRGEVGKLAQEFTRMQQAIAEREASLNHHARHDSLTGLVNRFHLEQLIEQSIAEMPPAGRRLVVAIIDLARFKDVNDTLGHNHGDQLLREVGERLRCYISEQRRGAHRWRRILHTAQRLVFRYHPVKSGRHYRCIRQTISG